MYSSKLALVADRKRPVATHPGVVEERQFDKRLRLGSESSAIYRDLFPRQGKQEVEPVILRQHAPTPFTLSWHPTCGNIQCQDGSG